MNTYSITVLDSYELDDLVNYNWKSWNRGFSCVRVFEWRKDSEHCALGIAPIKTEGYAQDQYDLHAYHDYQAWKSGTVPHASLFSRLLDSLCTDGLLQPGHYLIRVSW